MPQLLPGRKFRTRTYYPSDDEKLVDHLHAGPYPPALPFPGKKVIKFKHMVEAQEGHLSQMEIAVVLPVLHAFLIEVHMRIQIYFYGIDELLLVFSCLFLLSAPPGDFLEVRNRVIIYLLELRKTSEALNCLCRRVLGTRLLDGFHKIKLLVGLCWYHLQSHFKFLMYIST